MLQNQPDKDGDADKDDAHQHMPLVVNLLVIVIPPKHPILTVKTGVNQMLQDQNSK